MNDVCLYAGISKQGHSQALRREEEIARKEPSYLGFIANIRDIHPGMGLRAIYDQYQPEGIGRDAFIALGLCHGFRVLYKTNPVRTTYSIKSHRYINLLVDRDIDNINQVWVSDITYFPWHEGFYYIASVMDLYSRRIIGYSVADSLRAEHSIRALRMALNLRGIKDYNKSLIHHSDRGSQYVSNDYTELLEEFGILISMCDDVLENSHSERSHGTLKNQYLEYWRDDMKSEKDIPRFVDKAYHTYNHLRHHQSLGMTPVQYETYVKELEKKDRPKMSIYTIKMDAKQMNQLALDL